MKLIKGKNVASTGQSAKDRGKDPLEIPELNISPSTYPNLVARDVLCALDAVSTLLMMSNTRLTFDQRQGLSRILDACGESLKRIRDLR